MSFTKKMFNEWWERAGKVMTMWDQLKVNKIYEILISRCDDNDFDAVAHYMNQMFGFCCYVYSDISTLLDGQVRSIEQRNFFYRDYIDSSKKGSYSAIPNKFSSRDDISLQKCCRDYFLLHLSVSNILFVKSKVRVVNITCLIKG